MPVSHTVSLGLAQACPSYEADFAETNVNSARQPEPAHVYMDTDSEDRAPCSGIVYAWHYCSFPTSGDAPFHVLLAMYHTGVDDTYELVNGSLYNLMVDGYISSFTCRDVFLDPSEQFVVEQGDMVATCWSENINRVEMFGFKWQQRLAYWSSGLCSYESMNTLSTSGMMSRRRRTLLLFPYISK